MRTLTIALLVTLLGFGVLVAGEPEKKEAKEKTHTTGGGVIGRDVISRDVTRMSV